MNIWLAMEQAIEGHAVSNENWKNKSDFIYFDGKYFRDLHGRFVYDVFKWCRKDYEGWYIREKNFVKESK